MADYNRNNRFGRDRNRGGGGGFGRRDFNDRPSRGPVEMHSAVCDNCGNQCEVPFRPTSGKPVYCSNCFERRNNEPRNDHRDNGSRNTPQPQNNNQMEQLNAKLDKIISLLSPSIETEVKNLPALEVTEEVIEAPKEETITPKAKKAKKPSKKTKSPIQE